MLIKAKLGDKIIFCGHLSQASALKQYANCDLYYLVNELADPSLTTETGAISVRDSNFGSARWLFLEFDKELPEFDCPPTKIVQSSPGHYHVYWKVPEMESLSLDEVKRYFRALSQKYGTDLTKPLQMLRLPGSKNYKYNPPADVILLEENHRAYRLSDFKLTLEEPRKRAKDEKPDPIHQALLAYLLEQLNRYFPFPEKCHNNHLNATAFILIRDWANLAGRDELIDLLTQWASDNSHLPLQEIDQCLSKFSDSDRYPSRWLIEDGEPAELDYRKSLKFAYQSVWESLAVHEVDGKPKIDSFMAAAVKNWWLNRVLANVGYSPRCNNYLDRSGREINPFVIAQALDGFLIFNITKELSVVYGVLERNRIEPVCEYFKSLPKVSRSVAESTLRQLFIEIMSLSELDYIQARKWLVLTAKRARYGLDEPVINPYCLLLKGEQGVGKSAFFEILGGRFNYSYAQGQESTLEMLGSLTVTLDEYDRFTNKGQSEIKNLISDPVDRVRQKYARSAVSLNRLYSFGGTTNSSEILKDPTGSRRFLIVTMPQQYRQPYDIEWLRRNRDLIWASALALADTESVEFERDTINKIEDNKIQYEATTHQEELLYEWIAGNNEEAIPYRPNTAYSYSEVAAIVSPNKLLPGEKSHLIDLLLKLGWRKGSGRRDGKKINWMISPDSPKTESPKTQTPKTESPKTQTPKTQTPKTQTPKTQTPKTESPKTQTPKTQTPKTESPKPELSEPKAKVDKHGLLDPELVDRWESGLPL